MNTFFIPDWLIAYWGSRWDSCIRPAIEQACSLKYDPLLHGFCAIDVPVVAKLG